MKVAVFSDVHGNPYACQAVLAAVQKEGELTAVIAAGDLCFGGSDPARCVDLLRERSVLALYGNTDQFIYSPEKMPPDEPHLKKWDSIKAQAHWAAERLGPERVSWLKKLPFDKKISPTSDPDDSLLVVHANPKNVHDVILPSAEEQEKIMGEVEQPDDDPLLISLIEKVASRLIVFGHIHYSFERQWYDYTLVGVGSCIPSPIDGDRRARYTLFDWRAGRRWLTRRFVDYDYSQERDALLAGELPFKEKAAAEYE